MLEDFPVFAKPVRFKVPYSLEDEIDPVWMDLVSSAEIEVCLVGFVPDRLSVPDFVQDGVDFRVPIFAEVGGQKWFPFPVFGFPR